MYNSHVDLYYHSKIKIVGPDYNDLYDPEMYYTATIGDYDLDCICGYGRNPADAKDDLLAQLGY